jgi:hypothetical protein
VNKVNEKLEIEKTNKAMLEKKLVKLENELNEYKDISRGKSE